jgi:phenylacetate-coenzyme A ligase PaaK-like adenylate-forming protein
MPIIGRLLKKTTELNYKRTVHKGLDYKDQLKTLHKLVRYASNTQFGVHNNFSEILDAPDMVGAFQQNVPFTDYEQFYNDWLHRAIDGESDVAWPGVVKYYALSSGTTGSPSKRIPVTKQMIRSFQRTTIKQFTSIAELNLPDGFYQKSFLAVGGSSKLEKVGNHIEGDLSGILKKHTSIVLLPLTKPDGETAAIKDWNQKLDRMVEMATSWDISTIAGVPSWCIMLMERIVAHYKVNNIHDIWPNLELYLSGGVYVEPYLSRLHKVCGRPIHVRNTYLASEGYFAYQKHSASEGMQLLLKTGIFFEFVPFNRENFDESGNITEAARALTINEVAAGEDYALVISTNAGLWRYMIGDLVQFTDVEKREIKISGRIKQYLSLVGEHLSLDNINVAIQRTSEELQIDIPEFCLFADTEKQCHRWYFGSPSTINEMQVMQTVDRILGELNDDYRAVRKYNTLKDPIPTCTSMKIFYDFMEAKGKLGSQNKFPRVMNQHQSKEWRLFVNQFERPEL